VARLSTAFAAFHRVAFASRVPASGIGHSLAFDSLRRVKSATSSGMDVTPVSFRPSQSPLVSPCTRLLFLRRVRFDFPQLSLLPIGRFHLAAPVDQPRPFTCFRFASSCEADDILRYGCYPCLVRAESEPPGRRPPAPGSSTHRHDPVAGMTSDQLGSARLSAAFAVYRPVAFTSRFPSVAGGLHDTAFDRSASVSPDRVLGMHATPLPPGGRVPPGRQPSCARILLCGIPSDLSHEPFA